MEEHRGSLSFFTTYRPTVAPDIYSCPISPTSKEDEICMTDELAHNYNGHFIPPETLKKILQHPNLASSQIDEDDVDSGRLSGLVFVSERGNGLETLHFSLRHEDDPPMFKVFQFSHVYDTCFDGVRMEDSGCIAGDDLIYVTTKDPASERRQPWTAVYKTNLVTGETTRLTPPGQADLNPAVSPCGTKIAVASFEGKPGGWEGEIDYLNTNIFVMNIEEPYNRELVIEGGGWPTWGSENVLFFHRLVREHWGVFRADVSNDGMTPDIIRITPDDIDAITPAAIDETNVAVVTIREKSDFEHVKRSMGQYRHIEIFDIEQEEAIQITQNTKPMADHYNPFVIGEFNGERRIGYHRCNTESVHEDGVDMLDKLEEIQSPEPNVDLFRLSGAFPSFSKDLSKLAFVDNEFKTVYVVDSKGLHPVFEADESNSVFAPVWSQDTEKDTLYVCMGPAFHPEGTVEICAILDASSAGEHQLKQLTTGSNNAFPCTNPDGTKLVFRSTIDGGEKKYKNLYIIENLEELENGDEGEITRLTDGPWVDTHCEWSPSGEWIVFASNRHRASDDADHGLDTGYFAVYIVKADDPDVWVRVVGSRGHDLAGHVNHPFFSPDGKSLVVVADLAAVSCDPISMPHFIHSVRPYGDIFILDIDHEDIYNNEDVEDFRRVTHTRYENSTAVWTKFSSHEFSHVWNTFFTHHKHRLNNHAHDDEGETWHVSGHICIPRRSKRC